MEAAATGPDLLNAIGLAYVEFALQKRGLFRLMFGPILVERAKHPGLDEAARAVFDLLRRVVVGAEGLPRQDNSEAMAAWGLVHGLSSLFIDGLVPEARARGLAEEILVRCPVPNNGRPRKPPLCRGPFQQTAAGLRASGWPWRTHVRPAMPDEVKRA